MEDQLQEVVQLVEAGVTWAEQDTHPWELFIRRVHEMFLRVLKARKQKEHELGLMFPAQFRKEPRNKYPWHQIQLPQTKRRATPVPVLGPLPKEWRWGPDLLPAVLSWLSELQWLDLPPAEERYPRAHWQVSFMELAIDLEAYAGRQLPPAPRSQFQGGDMSLQEKARVMRLITTLLGRSVGKESILPAKLTNSCKSLIPMGQVRLWGWRDATSSRNRWTYGSTSSDYGSMGKSGGRNVSDNGKPSTARNAQKSRPAARSSHDLRQGTGHGAQRKEEQRRAILRQIFTPDQREDQRNLSMWTKEPKHRSRAGHGWRWHSHP